MNRGRGVGREELPSKGGGGAPELRPTPRTDGRTARGASSFRFEGFANDLGRARRSLGGHGGFGARWIVRFRQRKVADDNGASPPGISNVLGRRTVGSRFKLGAKRNGTRAMRGGELERHGSREKPALANGRPKKVKAIRRRGAVRLDGAERPEARPMRPAIVVP